MRRPLLALLAAGALLSACGGGDSGSSPAPSAAPGTDAAAEPVATSSASPAPDSTSPADSAAPTTPNAEAPAALQFSAPAVGGGEIDFTQYAGRSVVLWFWAPT